jgi:mono/diheme cytochrome c family protein
LAGAAVLLVAVFGIEIVYMGVFDVAADRPHTQPVAWLMQTVRDHSIEASAQGVIVPSDLGTPSRVKRGAAEYGEMCAMCHLGPGVERSEISQGLYPRAPELAGGTKRSVAEQFWIVKHGLKMTAMPAWGATHDDAILWDVVAFLQKLPGLTPDQYRELTRDAAEEHEKMGGHDSHDSMPGTNH